MNDMRDKLNRLKAIGLVFGVLGLAGCCLGYGFNRGPFFVSYLFAFLFWTSLSLGCFYSGMIHYLTAGKWGFAARRRVQYRLIRLRAAMWTMMRLFIRE